VRETAWLGLCRAARRLHAQDVLVTREGVMGEDLRIFDKDGAAMALVHDFGSGIRRVRVSARSRKMR
jgi:hypothetical protein